MDQYAIKDSIDLRSNINDEEEKSSISEVDDSTYGPCPIQGIRYVRRRQDSINIPWPVPIKYRRGSHEFLCGIKVYHDFEWQDVMHHNRSQFKNGKQLASLAKKDCPPEKTPAILLTIRDDVKAGKYETDAYFVLIVNIQKYREFIEWNVASEYFVNTLKSRVTCLSDLEDNDIIQLSQSNPERFEKLKEMIRNVDSRLPYNRHATKEDVVDVFKRIENIDGDLIDIILNLFLDGGVEVDYLLKKILESKNAQDLSAVMDWMLDGDAAEVLKHIRRLNVDNIQKLDTLAGICRLKTALEMWNGNSGNSDEDFWQKTLEENSFIISHVFTFPVILMQGKAYVGGKGIDNKGGNIVDFLYQNEITTNVSLIEIKAPTTPILLENEFRNGIYNINSNIIGAVQQIRNYKDTLMKEYHDIKNKSEKDFQTFNPHCLVIAGNGQRQFTDANKKKSFELFRNGLKDVQVITYDELFRKVEILLNLLENG